MMTEKQAWARFGIRLSATLVLTLAAFFAPVFIADLYLDLRGVPGPRDFNGLMWMSFCVGSCLALVAGMGGLRWACRVWTGYYRDLEAGQHCIQCGYPLEGLVGKAIACPECGFIIPRPMSRDEDKESAADQSDPGRFV